MDRLKGWRKGKYRGTYWWNSTPETRGKQATSIRIKRAQGKFGVWLNRDDNISFTMWTLLKEFKTKSQALAYAKNYMRRHPNG